ncbi:serine/threonine-protein kinase roco8 [Biomphalaria pfeifferi]|uniref:Serine/threonine-protein kinase roco8 n=1 Tax=Biomphalaria pfeifferi TaxID=112525 RepID=A0AAD8FA63_BIOPF|nr:serine/threonine-protein kinase roco8 [Biomphalaria pfeifferi]
MNAGRLQLRFCLITSFIGSLGLSHSIVHNVSNETSGRNNQRQQNVNLSNETLHTNLRPQLASRHNHTNNWPIIHYDLQTERTLHRVTRRTSIKPVTITDDARFNSELQIRDTSKFRGLVVGASVNSKLKETVKKKIKEIEASLWRLQSQKTTTFQDKDQTPMSILGAFPSEVKTNFHGTDEQSKLRHAPEDSLPDVNSLSNLFILMCLVESQLFGGSQISSTSNLALTVQSLEQFQSRTFLRQSSILTLWPEKMMPTVQGWVNYPENLVLTRVKDNTTLGRLQSLVKSCDCEPAKSALKEIDSKPMCKEYLNTPFSDIVYDKARPPDFLTSFANLALGCLLYARYEKDTTGKQSVFQNELNFWLTSNPDIQLHLNKLKEMIITLSMNKNTGFDETIIDGHNIKLKNDTLNSENKTGLESLPNQENKTASESKVDPTNKATPNGKIVSEIKTASESKVIQEIKTANENKTALGNNTTKDKIFSPENETAPDGKIASGNNTVPDSKVAPDNRTALDENSFKVKKKTSLDNRKKKDLAIASGKHGKTTGVDNILATTGIKNIATTLRKENQNKRTHTASILPNNKTLTSNNGTITEEKQTPAPVTYNNTSSTLANRILVTFNDQNTTSKITIETSENRVKPGSTVAPNTNITILKTDQINRDAGNVFREKDSPSMDNNTIPRAKQEEELNRTRREVDPVKVILTSTVVNTSGNDVNVSQSNGSSPIPDAHISPPVSQTVKHKNTTSSRSANQIIDSPSYYGLSSYLKGQLKDGKETVLVPTWISFDRHGDVRDSNNNLFRSYNSIDLTTTATVLHALILSHMTGFVNLDVETELVNLVLSSLRLLTWYVSNIPELNTFLGVSRYPSRSQLFWILSRTAFQLQSVQATSKHLFKFATKEIEAFLATLRKDMTFIILQSIVDGGLGSDGKTRVHVDEFLGVADLDNKNAKKITGDDRLFASAMAINTLVSTWTVQQDDGTLQFIKGTDDSVRIAVNSLVNYVSSSVDDSSTRQDNAYMTDQVKNCQTFSAQYPSNVVTTREGKVISTEEMSYKLRHGVKGVYSPEAYQKELDSPIFSERKQESDSNPLNTPTSLFRYWSSTAYTKAACILAIAQAANLQVGHD